MSREVYCLKDSFVWDFWYAQQNGVWHAFYLQYPRTADPAFIHERQSVGHATSADLLNWDEQTVALAPEQDSWNDLGIATGSVVLRDGRWYMLYTGNSSTGAGGIGLAVSSDLLNWQRIGSEPVLKRGQTIKAPWKGNMFEVVPLADPYVYPELIGGWNYMLLNVQDVHAGGGTRGCQMMLRSRNLLDWEAHAIVAYPGCYERLETSQLWEHGGRWYLYFGGVGEGNQFHNLIYIADRFDGPYEAAPWSNIQLPDGGYFYIAKVLQDEQGRDWLLPNRAIESLLKPVGICYGTDGAIKLEDECCCGNGS